MAVEPSHKTPRSGLLSRSLGAKAVTLLVGMVLLVAAMAFLVFRPYFARTFDEELIKRGTAMVKILEQHQQLRLALSLKDAARARSVAEEILKGDAEARFVQLMDGDGKLLGQAFVSGLDPLASDLTGNEKQEHSLRGGVHRFTGEVAREGVGEGELDFAEDQPAVAKTSNLGRIVLGLSANVAQERLSGQTLLTILLTAIVLVGAFLVFFSRVSVRLNRISDFAEQLARGDLITELPDDQRDEIGRLAASLAQMSRNIAGMVRRLQLTAQQLDRGSAEILASASHQSQAATRQAAAVAQTSATVAALRDIFNRAAEHAQAVIDLARKSEESSSSGKTAVAESVAAMQQIGGHVDEIARTITGFVDRVNQISEIVDAVNLVTEQSNLLAINAEIEAAKAGDRARGFAVIAREVRDLAERSKGSTTEIRGLLRDIQSASEKTSGVIQEGTERSRAGMELSSRAGEAILHLASAIGESSTAAKEIASSIRYQGSSVNQISNAIDEIDRSVNESAAGIRQLEGASKNMKGLSENMMELVLKYRVGGSERRD